MKKQPKQTISPVDAMKILRSGIKESRPAQDFDWDRLEGIFQRNAQTPPPGSRMLIEISKRMGHSRGRTQKILDEMVAGGIMETGLFPNPNGNGRAKFYWSTMKKKGAV